MDTYIYKLNGHIPKGERNLKPLFCGFFKKGIRYFFNNLEWEKSLKIQDTE
jgi:hypothetical protein